MFSKNQLINFDPNLEDHKVLGINRLPARATVVPAQKAGVYYRNKEESSFLRSLNGDYKFLYLKEDTEPNFFDSAFDDSKWDIIDVPSMWQYRGYGEPSYPNVKYPIPALPPFVKKQNPVGYYRKRFSVKTPAEKTVLHFGGVDNAFYVYLNGKPVGFSKGSRLPSEFDVTGLIRKGENVIAVKVFTYSDATYLENQDMLLASGIFRDVYLIESSADTLWDYRVRTSRDSVSVEIETEVHGEYDVRITLDGESASYPAQSRLSHTFKLENARLWTAETPNLYDLTIELVRDGHAFEVHSKRVGIMWTEVKNDRFLVNGSPIYIKGVNRHENNAKNGRAITVSQIETDLRMIKNNNLNAVRLAHYTNHPATYEIASEIGLYLMDEADLETHGAYVINGDQGFLSKSPDWFDAYYDRIKRMLEVNKNEVCIFMRSTGNECGRGENLNRLVDVIREFDPTRECVSAQDPGEKVRFRQFGYYTMAEAEEMSDEGYPVLAIEYAHAMGNGPGNLSDYWDYNYTHEKMVGGFVWEFRSHGFHSEDEKGNVYYKYGGDFSDVYHWYNFSMDGFCMSDGTPKPTWYELGNVLFAAYTTFADGKLCIKNTNDFLSLSYLSASYEIIEDGETVKTAVLEIPYVAPHDSFFADVDLDIPNVKAGARYHLNVCFFCDGKKVHTKQFSLGVLKAAPSFAPVAFDYKTEVENYVLKVSGNGFSLEFTKGMLSRFEKNGRVMLDRPIRLNFWRAHTDNDGINGHSGRPYNSWCKELLRHYYFNLYDIDVKESKESLSVSVLGRMTADSIYGGFVCKIVYDIYAEGNVLISFSGEPYGRLPETLPKIGIVLEVDKAFGECGWLGRGPLENYPDSKAAAPVGRYRMPIEKMNVPYDYPQETGNRENTVFSTLKASDGRALSIVGNKEFCFSYHDFSIDSLEDASHKNELEKSADTNYLYVDYKTRGLGSRSCGPDPEEKYELRPHSFEFSFMLSASDAEKALELSRFSFEHETRALSGKYEQKPIVRIPQIADCGEI